MVTNAAQPSTQLWDRARRSSNGNSLNTGGCIMLLLSRTMVILSPGGIADRCAPRHWPAWAFRSSQGNRTTPLGTRVSPWLSTSACHMRPPVATTRPLTVGTSSAAPSTWSTRDPHIGTSKGSTTRPSLRDSTSSPDPQVRRANEPSRADPSTFGKDRR